MKQSLLDFDAGWCRRLYFGSDGSNNYVPFGSGWDANGDGIFTIADIGLWLSFVFRLPAKAVLLAIDGTTAGKFFEVDCATGSGWGAATFCFFVWLFVFLIIAGMKEAVSQDLKARRDRLHAPK
jgi:hypothetical protein